MTKFRIAMDMDFADLAPELLKGSEADQEVVREAFTSMLIRGARANAKRELHDIRKDAVMDMDVKAIRMAEQLRKIMSTLMAEANLTVAPLDASTPISTTLPFEERYEEHRRAA